MKDVFDQSKRFLELWTDMATKMASAGLAADPDAAPTDAARQVRSAVFQAMTQQADQFMRSPQFLEFVKQSLDSSSQGREQLNDFFTRLHHEIQGVARQDIDNVLAGVHQLETRVIDRLEEVTNRLDELKRRLDALENGKTRAPQAAPKRSRKRGAR